MTRIAQLSDLHLNGTLKRSKKVAAAIDQAARAKASHLILTGDLTASGKLSEFQELKRILDGHWADGLTVVPGNHDGYGHFDNMFGKAPLVDLGGVGIIPIDTRYARRALAFWALGRIEWHDMQALERLAGFGASKPLLIAMHHGPISHSLEKFEGLINKKQVLGVLERLPTAHVLCGHAHQIGDYGRVHVAGSAAFHPDPLRLYDIAGGEVRPSYQSAIRVGRLARLLG